MTGDGRAATESLEQLKPVRRALFGKGGGDLGLGDGLVRLWADSGFPFWNALTLTDHRIDARSLERHLSAAADYMRGRRPGYLWLFADLLGDAAGEALAGLAQGAGLRRAMELSGMAGRVPSGPEPTHPELTFERVSTRAQLEAYADLNSRAYAMPPCGGQGRSLRLQALDGGDLRLPGSASRRPGQCGGDRAGGREALRPARRNPPTRSGADTARP